MGSNNNKAWVMGVILGILGVIVSSGIYIYIAWTTERIFGIVAILCGLIGGGAAGLGFRLGRGQISSADSAKKFLAVTTIFGFLGVAGAYIGPYLIFGWIGLPFSAYMELIEFDIMDVLFIVFGTFAGRGAGKSIGKTIMVRGAIEEHLAKASVAAMNKSAKKGKK